MRPLFRSGNRLSTPSPRTLAATWWRIRRRLRSPALYWTTAAAVGLVTTTTVARLVAEAEQGAERFGDAVAVARAHGDLAAGTLVGPGDVVVTELPRGAVPDDAVDAEVIGRRLNRSVVDGETLGRHHVAPGDPSALAAQLGAGQAGVAIGTRAADLPFESGDVVDVWGLDAATGRYRRVATGAAVIGGDDRATVVSVDDAELGAVIAAASDGSATLVLRGGP